MPLYYSEDHEWIDVAGDTGTVGITDYAQLSSCSVVSHSQCFLPGSEIGNLPIS